MNEGIDYYNNLFKEMKSNFSSGADKIIESIKKQKFKLDQISKKIDQIKKELA